MVRILGFLVGLGFVVAAAWAFGKGAWAYLGAPHEQTGSS